MAGTQVAARRRPRKKASAPRKRSTRRKTKARATGARRRKRSTVMAAAPKRRRRKPAKKRPARRRARASEAWYGDRAGHRKAAKKGLTPAGHRRKPRRRKKTTRRRRARASEPSMVAAPRRRRRSTTRRRSAPRGRAYAAAPRRGSAGMGMGEFGVAVVSAGFGYVIADGLDRFLATYNPAETDPEKRPKDKFTSDGAGTLANTLNVASPPGFMRIGAGIGVTALPAVASYYVKGKYIKSGLQGLAIGSGVNLFKTLWNNVLMPMLKPKDTSAAALQKSYIARLYPAEVAASINREAKQTAVSSAGGAGALSDAPSKQAGVAQPPDVGPFALSEMPTATQALREGAGMGAGTTPGDNFPTVQQVWGTGQDFPTVQQVMTEESGLIGDALGAVLPAAAVQVAMKSIGRGLQAKGVTLKCVQTGVSAPAAPAAPAAAAGVSQADTGNPGQPGVSQPEVAPSGSRRDAWEPGPPPLPGPGPQPAIDDPACACLGEGDQFLGFMGDQPTEEPLFSTTTQ